MVIDIQKELATCVNAIGGEVLDDVLVNPNFKNADYWFPEYNVVAELKQLSENILEKNDYKQKLTDMYWRWVREGLVTKPTGNKVKFSTRNIPEKCAYEWVELFKKRLESSTVRKANTQIKETKKHLNAPSAKGLLLLANNGNLGFTPSVVAHLLARMLKTSYSSINSIIYFSANHPVSHPGISMPSHFWIDAFVGEREQAPKELREKLQTEWMKHYSGLIEGPLYEVLVPNKTEAIDAIKFTKKPNK
jgi:hypothetical protein